MKFYNVLKFLVLVQVFYTQTTFAQNKDFTITSDTITVDINEVGIFESTIENLLDEELEIYHITLNSSSLSAHLSDFIIPNRKFILEKKGEEGSKRIIEIIFSPARIYNNICMEMFVFSKQSEERANLCINMSTSNIVDNFSKEAINISPNPASDFVTIQFSNKGLQPFAEVYKVQIFDVLGIEIMSVETRHAVSLQRIDVSHLSAGVYFIRFGNKMEKFVKM